MSDVTDQLDKRHFELSPEDWEKFKAAVDAPPKFNARLVALLGRKRIVEDL